MRSDHWQLSPPDFRKLTERLRSDFYKWDIYVNGTLRIIPESIIISKQEHNFIVKASETISRLLRKTEAFIKKDRDILRSLNIPEKLIPLIMEEPPVDYQLARYDFFLTDQNSWQLSEFNEDVPGGFNDAIGAPRLLSEMIPRYSNCRYSFERDLGESMLEAISEDGPVGLVYATAYAEDLQHMLVLKKLFEARSQSCVLCSPSHLKQRWGRPSLADTEVSSVIRFYPAEWFQNLDNLKIWRNQIGNLKMFNPLSRLISQSKKLFALLEEMPFLTDEERCLLSGLLPRTTFFRNDRAKMLLEEKDEWVIKEAFGRMGDTVYIGKIMEPTEWEKLVTAACLKPEKFLIQKCFAVKSVNFESGGLYPAIGAYVINGKFAGYYSRASSKPILTHEAYYVPTLVENT